MSVAQIAVNIPLRTRIQMERSNGRSLKRKKPFTYWARLHLEKITHRKHVLCQLIWVRQKLLGYRLRPGCPRTGRDGGRPRHERC
jgi:hypothetical protein